MKNIPDHVCWPTKPTEPGNINAIVARSLIPSIMNRTVPTQYNFLTFLSSWKSLKQHCHDIFLHLFSIIQQRMCMPTQIHHLKYFLFYPPTCSNSMLDWPGKVWKKYQAPRVIKRLVNPRSRVVQFDYSIKSTKSPLRFFSIWKAAAEIDSPACFTAAWVDFPLSRDLRFQYNTARVMSYYQWWANL
jgi:hypothetical protein